MATPDPQQVEHVNFFVSNIREITTGIILALLFLLKKLGKEKEATQAKDVLVSPLITEDRVDVKLAECQLAVVEKLDEIKDTLMDEISKLHERQNEHINDHHIKPGG